MGAERPFAHQATYCHVAGGDHARPELVVELMDHCDSYSAADMVVPVRHRIAVGVPVGVLAV